MNIQKFLAVVKYEYRKVVLKWSFLIGTLLFPLIATGFAVVPALIFSINGAPTRIVVIDKQGIIAPRLKENLSAEKMREKQLEKVKESMPAIDGSQDKQLEAQMSQITGKYDFINYDGGSKSLEQIESELGDQIRKGELDAYLVVPDNFDDKNADFQFFSRKPSELLENRTVKNALNDAVRSHRFLVEGISDEKFNQLNEPVKLSVQKIDEKGEKSGSGTGFVAGFAIAFMIYLNLAIYGQMIMSTVVEEKETKVSEILFSSAKPFELMFGKLVGVGLAGLTQFAIWVVSAALVVALILPVFMLANSDFSIPPISVLDIFYFLLYFLIGFFLYASIFALIGSMVSSVQEGGQFAFLPVMLMLIGFYFSFAVIRDPNSTLSIWASILPFVAPMTMPIRILTEMPPFWQIAASIVVNLAAITGLVWLASRVYRIGMLMYGKRATIPEVWKWIWQR